MNARSVALREELLASLDEEDSLDDLVDADLGWHDELLRRSDEISSGAVATVGWDQVLERVADSRRPW